MSSLVEKNVGSRVLSGTQNKGGALTVLVDADGVHSALARLVANVREGFELKAVRSGIADSMSQKYVPAVVITAVGAALLWSWKGPEPRLGFAFTSLAMILIAACPWAVTTASPIAIAFGLRRGKRLGMRIRNPRVLEKLDRVDVVIFDKKGVLTEGCPRIRDVIRFGRWDEEELLQKAVVAQRRTGHPFASTLAHRASKADIPEAESQESYPGQGVAVTLGGDRILAGSLAWISRQGISVPAEGERRLKRSPDPVLVLAVCGQAAGAVIFEDEIRPGVREVVRELEKMGIEAVLASGDHNASAHRVAEEVGIRQVYSEVGEEEKVEIVREFQTQGKKVVMIGDGKRDAAALSRADLGISIGTEGEEGLRLSERRPVLGAGIDLAAESADIVLIRRDLDHLLGALRLSLKIREVIRENLKWVFGFHILLIPAAAGAYMLSFSAGFPPAAILTAASLSLAAILVNSIRRFKRER
jgi:Cu+-exporting ATPase